jgi:hypothetical protein
MGDIHGTPLANQLSDLERQDTELRAEIATLKAQIRTEEQAAVNFYRRQQQQLKRRSRPADPTRRR